MKKEDMQMNSSAPAPKPIVAWVGLDWADKKHQIVARFCDGSKSLREEVEHKPQVIDEFFLDLHHQYPHGKIAVVIEQSRGPVIYALMKYSFVEIYPINPKALSSYRESLRVSGAKDDKIDAELQADFGAKHSENLRVLKVDDIPTRKLRFLVEARRDFVDGQTALTNALRAVLKGYYPVVLELFERPFNSPILRDFLLRWPTMAELKTAKPETLRKFFYKHNSRSEELIQERLEKIKSAAALTEDEAIVDAHKLQAKGLLRQLEQVEQTIAEYHDVIQKTFKEHSSFAIFNNLPGAGPALAPRLAAAFGSRRENFQSPQEILCLSGVAPVRKQSGQMDLVFFRWKKPRFLHQSFVEFAKCSIGTCQWAQLYFREQMKDGKGKWAAFRALAFKWGRILWRCWQDGTPYDEAKYLRSLQRKGIKLYESLYKDLPAEGQAAGCE
jgi:transposase